MALFKAREALESFTTFSFWQGGLCRKTVGEAEGGRRRWWVVGVEANKEELENKT